MGEKYKKLILAAWILVLGIFTYTELDLCKYSNIYKGKVFRKEKFDKEKWGNNSKERYKMIYDLVTNHSAMIKDGKLRNENLGSKHVTPIIDPDGSGYIIGKVGILRKVLLVFDPRRDGNEMLIREGR
ncbi:MAG: hypothetical protein KBF12_03000 [Sebaldella sp.]|nr:hypothetical protein [Sebaldella sp.]